MNITDILESLKSSYNKPMMDYLASPEARELISHPETVKILSDYDLPEITKLICGEGSLRNEEWGRKYKLVCLLYWNLSKEDIQSLMIENDAGTVISEVLPYMDYRMLGYALETAQSLKNDNQSWKTKSDEVEEEITNYCVEERNIIEKLRDTQKTLDDEAESEEKKSLQRELKEILHKKERAMEEKKRLEEEYSSIIDVFGKGKALYQEIYRIMNSYSESMRDRRDKVIGLDLPLTKEDKLLKKIRDGGDLSEYSSSLRDKQFCMSLLERIEETAEDQYVNILAELYNLGVIDIYEAPFYEGLKEHFSLVVSYAAEQSNNNEEGQDWNEFLWDLILNNEFLEDYSIELQPVLDSLDSVDKWKYVFGLIEEHYQDRRETLLAYLFLNASGNSRIILREILENAMFADPPVLSVKKFTAALIRCKDKGDQVQFLYADQLMERLEDDLKEEKRKRLIAERENAKTSSRIFSAVYMPVEKLEKLAIDIKDENKLFENNYNVIVKHLIDDIKQLRDGLDNVGLHTIGNSSDWEMKKEIAFDPSVHSYEEKRKEKEEKDVVLHTMGFKYLDEDSNEQVYKAKVISPDPALL